MPPCGTRQQWRRHQRAGSEGVVGEQERGVHYKERLSSEERANIQARAEGRRRRGESHREEEEERRGKRRRLQNEDLIHGDFIPHMNPQNTCLFVLILRRRAVSGRQKCALGRQ